jgi:8-oxo-dGTP pyrophosphatase MutT (NUDIX family)
LATPGGGVEEGESELSTARREVYEELNVSVDLRGPVHTPGDRFEYEGILVENTDVFFVGRCSADAPRLDRFTEAERAVMKAAKWGAIEEIENSDETIFPLDLGAMVRHFA